MMHQQEVSQVNTPQRPPFPSNEEAANIILGHMKRYLPPVRSVVNVGCDADQWKRCLKEHGIGTVHDIDRHTVADYLGEENNREYDALGKKKKFDLAISLEHAHYLLPPLAKKLVTWLTDLSDIVLFSSAIPGQGGSNHLNPQWPDYWAELFYLHDYCCCDLIRPAIWNARSVPYWYRQNALLYIREDKYREIREQSISTQAASASLQTGTEKTLQSIETPLSLVHPALYNAWRTDF